MELKNFSFEQLFGFKMFTDQVKQFEYCFCFSSLEFSVIASQFDTCVVMT